MRDWYFRIFSWWKGQLVGYDEFGNHYYQDNPPNQEGLKCRRWVVYKGEEDASRVPAEWHGWLHHRTDKLPTLNQPYDWIKPHLPNLTGTRLAHRAQPSVELKKNYKPWKP